MKPVVNPEARYFRANAACAAFAFAHMLSAQCQPEWSSVGGGANVSIDSLAVHDEDGEGPQAPALFLGSGAGVFAGVDFYLSARWDGWAASPVGDQTDGNPGLGIFDLLAIPEPQGLITRGLFAAGGCKFKDGLKAVARWDGQGWNALGLGVNEPPGAMCFSSRIFDEDGDGPLLPHMYVGGQFTAAGNGVQVDGLARWNGVDWSEVGGGLSTGLPNVRTNVFALCVFDDGRGPALYAGGSFKYAAGKLAYSIARWDGQAWEPVGEVGLNAPVESLCVYDEDGPGPLKPALFAGGQFDQVIGQPEHTWLIARWDGQAWTDVGDWISSGVVSCMTVWKGPDDDRENLYIGGTFNILPDMTDIKGIARWDGQAWRQVDYGISGFGSGTGVLAMAAFDEDGQGPNPGGLYVGGRFYYAGTKGVESHFIARWGCPLAPRCEADLDRSGALDLFDFLAFLNLVNAEDPTADCTADGALDLFDFLCFVNAFNAGC